MTNSIRVYYRRLLILAICFLCIIFLTIDVYRIDFVLSSSIIKFISILFCLLISIISNPLYKQSRDIFLLQLGLIFTVMADYIFLIQGQYFSLAITFFSISQIIYILRYLEDNSFERIINLGIVYLVINISYMTLGRVYEIEYPIFIGLFYAICLILSVYGALERYRANRYEYTNRLILLGMLLFLLCDINVGLNYILGEIRQGGPNLNLIQSISSISIWAYYLPSQILLSLSGSNNT